MPKRKLPQGFSSWIQFHDYIKATKPELLKEKTIRFMEYQPEGGAREVYSISIPAIYSNCWRELQALGFKMDDVRHVLHQVLYSSADIKTKEIVINFLSKL